MERPAAVQDEHNASHEEQEAPLITTDVVDVEVDFFKLKADDRSRGRSQAVASVGVVWPLTATRPDLHVFLHERPDRPLVGGG
jgi:hypothetical protein